MKKQIKVVEKTKYYVETENNEWSETVEMFTLYVGDSLIKSESQIEDDGCFYYDTKVDKEEVKEHLYDSIEDLDNAGWFFINKHTLRSVELELQEQ